MQRCNGAREIPLFAPFAPFCQVYTLLPPSFRRSPASRHSGRISTADTTGEPKKIVITRKGGTGGPAPQVGRHPRFDGPEPCMSTRTLCACVFAAWLAPLASAQTPALLP